MIKRYSFPEMVRIFSDEVKYQTWLKVELAVIAAREEMGLIPQGTHAKIKKQAKFDIAKIDEIEARTQHDLLAFVECVQSFLDPELRKFFHAEGMTSYDTEEPATALILRNALKITIKNLDLVCRSIREQAVEYKYLLKIHRTHGQHAEPTTFGLELLFWLDSIERQRAALKAAQKEMRFTKISGAVGTYAGGLSPELEMKALLKMGLYPAKVSAQIILRDRHAAVMNTLAVLAGVIENIALNIRLYGQTEICEIQEPFKKGQKGSSVMPHKKNTILTENLCGLMRTVRGYAATMLESIPTWSARDISHSSVERIIFPDAFHLVNFGMKRIRGVIEGLQVKEKNIERNLRMTKGTIFSPMVKEVLLESGMDPDEAYYLVQQAAFDAIEKNEDFLSILLDHPTISDDLKLNKIPKVFNYEATFKYVDSIFDKFA